MAEDYIPWVIAVSVIAAIICIAVFACLFWTICRNPPAPKQDEEYVYGAEDMVDDERRFSTFDEAGGVYSQRDRLDPGESNDEVDGDTGWGENVVVVEGNVDESKKEPRGRRKSLKEISEDFDQWERWKNSRGSMVGGRTRGEPMQGSVIVEESEGDVVWHEDDDDDVFEPAITVGRESGDITYSELEWGTNTRSNHVNDNNNNTDNFQSNRRLKYEKMPSENEKNKYTVSKSNGNISQRGVLISKLMPTENDQNINNVHQTNMKLKTVSNTDIENTEFDEDLDPPERRGSDESASSNWSMKNPQSKSPKKVSNITLNIPENKSPKGMPNGILRWQRSSIDFHQIDLLGTLGSEAHEEEKKDERDDSITGKVEHPGQDITDNNSKDYAPVRPTRKNAKGKSKYRNSQEELKKNKDYKQETDEDISDETVDNVKRGVERSNSNIGEDFKSKTCGGSTWGEKNEQLKDGDTEDTNNIENDKNIRGQSVTEIKRESANEERKLSIKNEDAINEEETEGSDNGMTEENVENKTPTKRHSEEGDNDKEDKTSQDDEDIQQIDQKGNTESKDEEDDAEYKIQENDKKKYENDINEMNYIEEHKKNDLNHSSIEITESNGESKVDPNDEHHKNVKDKKYDEVENLKIENDQDEASGPNKSIDIIMPDGERKEDHNESHHKYINNKKYDKVQMLKMEDWGSEESDA